MQPQQLRKLVRKWTIPVVLMTLLGAGVGFGVSKAMRPVYQATATVLVVAAPASQAQSGLATTVPEVTATAAALMTEPPMLQRVINELHLNESTEDLAKTVTATPETNAELVDVSAKDPEPERATAIANSVANDYVDQVNSTNQARVDQASKSLQDQITQLGAQLTQDEATLASTPRGQDTTQIKAQITSESALLAQITTNLSSFKATQAQSLETVSVAAAATTPTSPASPKMSLNTILGALAGLLIGLALAALMEFLDQGLHTEQDVADRLGVPCLGVIPSYPASRLGEHAPGAANGKKSERRARAASEAYRRLRTNLIFSSLDGPLKTVVITSVRAGEGKTRTAANLAVALAGAEKNVLLVDADMRKPSQHKVFRTSLHPGFSDVLVAAANAGEAVAHPTRGTNYPGLSLLTCGTIPPNPSELLASRRATSVVRAFETQHDIIVVDTPPCEAITDAVSVAADASATILVIEAGKTNAAQAAAVIYSLRKVGAKVAGVVLNKAREKDAGAYYYYESETPSESDSWPAPKTDAPTPEALMVSSGPSN